MTVKSLLSMVPAKSVSVTEWTSLPLGEGACVTFSPGGKILHGDADSIEEELFYLVRKLNGAIEILKPSEFQSRLNDTEAAP